ncbi:MAG TPA: DMT family transporter [Candidatus Kapabacteria bacterium]|nr:DMT family transporter [Candidatus Kapabacteria bacterium]
MMKEHLSHPKRRRAVIALTVLTCVWGTTFIIVQRALADVTPLLFAAIRFSIALVCFVGFFPVARTGIRMLFSPRTPDERILRKDATIIGISLGVGYIFQFLGLLTTTTSKSAFLTATTILWTPLFSGLLGHEKFSVRKVLTVLAAAVGIVLLIHPYPIEKIVIGDVFSALCAVAFGAYILWLDTTNPILKKVVPKESNAAIILATMQLTVALGVILVTMPFVESPHITVTGNDIFAILYTAILTTAISTFMQAYYQKEITPTAATLIYTLEPVVTALIGFILVGETMNPAELAGCGLIIGAMIAGQV